jgi:ABC-type antimicrobial peptide transport system permease subunit
VANAPSVAGFVTPRIDFVLLLEGGLVALTIGVAGSVIPAYRSTMMDPAAILRGN